MCLTPKIIVNPKFVNQCNNYPMLDMNGRELVYTRSCNDFFDYHNINPRRYGVTFENIDRFLAFNMAGEAINVFISVACGHCLECVQSKRQALFTRMVCEQIGHGDIMPIFFTLTYNDLNLPSDRSVSVDDVRKFFNRFYLYLRRKGVTEEVRHIYFSEYCPSTGRPHYHGLIFGLPVSKYWPWFLDFLKWFESTWGKGYIHAKHFQPRGFKYVSKYLLKGSNVPDGCKPNFWCGSRTNGGIGSKALCCAEFVHAALESNDFNLTYKVLGQVITFTLPKYLRDKIYPRLADFYPKDTVKRLKSLIWKLSKLNSYKTYFGSQIYSDEFDYVFPPQLVDKYPFFSYLYRDIFGNEHSLSDFSICDWMNTESCQYFSVESLENSIREDIKILDSFTPDIDMIRRRLTDRDRVMSYFVSRVLKYVSELPPPVDRLTYLNYCEDKLKLNVHSC